ncbi:MAG TPA: serine/threonine-protein kinase [Kofleriaceae bacterium]|nr:serine/threonine-protein kinase [Kofleriaceae bacterium]
MTGSGAGSGPGAGSRPSGGPDSHAGPDSGPGGPEFEGGPLAAGALLDGHAIEAFLGRGACGAVYRARDPDGRAVALKVLHAELVPSREHAHRFAREARALSLLRHPHVIAVERVGSLPGGQPYLVMELLAGRSLEAALGERGRFAADEIDRILEPLCDALGAAHALGIVHRDLKPSNVFLAASPGGAERVVLLDFGIAKLLDEEGITSARQIVGTPSSIAPEQILGQRVDARTDVYGLGALCHHLLTGRPTFAGPPQLALQHHLHVQPPRASAYAPIAADLDRVLARALAKAPDQRFVDAPSFLAAFRAAAFAPHRRVGGPGELALAIHLEVQAAAGEGDAVAADADAILARAAGAASAAGWVVLLESGNSLLAAVACPDRRARRAAIRAALELAAAIDSRPGATPRVSARVRLHVDGADRIEDWVPPPGGAGVLASPAVLDGLDLDLDLDDDHELDIDVEAAGDELRLRPRHSSLARSL